MDLRQSFLYAQFMRATGWEVKQISGIYIYLRRLFLGYRFAKIQRYTTKIDWGKLELFLRNNRVIFAVLEPSPGVDTQDYYQHRFRLSHSSYLPTKTNIIDLRQSRQQLLANLSANFRRILKHKTNFQFLDAEATQFYSDWNRSSKLWHLNEKDFSKLIKIFGTKIWLRTINLDNQSLSGVIILFSGNTAYYYQAWTNDVGRQSGAHHHLVWNTLLDLKKTGVNFFDFDGVFDERFKRNSWLGFSEFKRKFGGKEVEYPGSFQRWF